MRPHTLAFRALRVVAIRSYLIHMDVPIVKCRLYKKTN